MSESPVEKTKKKPDLIKFGNERCSDLILFVEDQDFIVHRMVLAAHSDVFDVMLFGGFKEAKEDRVEIKDVSVDIFKKILEIFYYGRMSKNEALHFVFDHEIGPVYKSPFHYYGATITYAEKYCRKLWNFVNELLAVADRFNVVELVLKSLQEEIAKNICTRNHCFYCLNFYMFAFEKNMPILDAFPCFTKDNYKAWHTAVFKEDLHIGQQPGTDPDFSREVSLMPFLPMLRSFPLVCNELFLLH